MEPLPMDKDVIEENDDWRRERDCCIGGPSGRHDWTEALIASISAPEGLMPSSLGLILILIFLTGSQSSESESELELLMTIKFD